MNIFIGSYGINGINYNCTNSMQLIRQQTGRNVIVINSNLYIMLFI